MAVAGRCPRCRKPLHDATAVICLQCGDSWDQTLGDWCREYAVWSWLCLGVGVLAVLVGAYGAEWFEEGFLGFLPNSAKSFGMFLLWLALNPLTWGAVACFCLRRRARAGIVRALERQDQADRAELELKFGGHDTTTIIPAG